MRKTRFGPQALVGVLLIFAAACGPRAAEERQTHQVLEEAHPVYPLSACPGRRDLSLSETSSSRRPHLFAERFANAWHAGERGEIQVVPDGLLYGDAHKSTLLRYWFQGSPLCGVYGRADHIGGRTLVHEPSLDWARMHGVVDSWPRRERAVEAFLNRLDSDTSTSVTASEACWWPDGNRLLPAWELELEAGGNPWRGYVGLDRGIWVVFRAGQRAFDAFDQAEIGETESSRLDPLDLLDGSGYLQGAHFRVVVPSSYEPAYSPDLTFAFGPDDPRFAQRTAFFHAEQMLAWLMRADHNYRFEDDCAPITIELHTQFAGGDVNNARYIPAGQTKDGKPAIRIGDGDGLLLQNLALDFDVIAHEIGHHVVYRAIKDTTDFESIVIHEAIADYFNFSMTGDACLGETICPLGSTACEVAQRCLRSGETQLAMDQTDLAQDPHRRSQVLSGMLWDLRKNLGDHIATPLVFKAIEFLLPRSRYRDFIVSLLLADAERHAGEHACMIYEFALARGLGRQLLDLDCRSFLSVE